MREGPRRAMIHRMINETEERIDRIIRGDYRDGIEAIPDGSIDLILTDPPYGVTECPWDVRPDLGVLWVEFNRVLKKDGAAILTATQPFATELILANRRAFRYDLVWVKSNPVGFLNARRMPLRQHELVLVFYRRLPAYHPQLVPRENRPRRTAAIRTSRATGGVYARCVPRPGQSAGAYPTSVLAFAKEGSGRKRHPTQKPVALFEHLIKSYSRSGETVLDPFMGSGTTAIAAIRSGRHFIGFEREEEFVRMAEGRIREEREGERSERRSPLNRSGRT